METILLLQITAHILADFFFQPEHWSLSKQKKGCRSFEMFYHSGVVFITSILFTFSISFILFALIISVSHLLIDLLKSYVERKISKTKNLSLSSGQTYGNLSIFIADQLFHLIIIYGSVYFFTQHNELPVYLRNIDLNFLLIIMGFLFCLKPANIFIRTLLLSLNLSLSEKSTNTSDSKREDLERAGRWIGAIERILAYFLVLLGQFTAIGFIIAAKSILRYNDKPLAKTEYVLIGTLMSFGIAIIFGLGVTKEAFTRILDLICF